MTHKFKLPSGVECEVSPLLGKHQRWLTEQSSVDIASNLNRVLADVLVRVGTETKIDEKFVLNMLALDRKLALLEVRQFTLDFPKLFEFNYDYKTRDGEKATEPFDVDISEGFKVVPLKVIEGDNIKEAPYTEYSEIEKEVNLILPKTKQKVKFRLLDGVGESVGAHTPKKKRSSHTAIYMRIPQVESTSKKGNPVWHKLDLDNLPISDIEYLRATIKELEGSVDTEFMFEHPEAEYKSSEEKDVVVDLITQIAFFFPSEAI